MKRSLILGSAFTLQATLVVACADVTPRAQTPTTTTGNYNTGTTATPGLSASHAAAATESGGGSVGGVAPASPVSAGSGR